MSVDRDEVLRIAGLAKLRLDEDELERMTGDLNSILGHVDTLAELEEEDVPREEERAEGRRSTRSGEKTDAEPGRLDPSTMAPSFRDGFFVVPPPPGFEVGGGGES
jgi:aspartyl-tRNA(Asn)/glutamyl-tRNA(Gln) amidotransferase subunit C